MTFLKRNKKGSKGFTLIELLVVIAIIGVLASIVLASLNTARKKSRDTRRVADMNQAKLALELYFDSNKSYPDTAASRGTALLVPTYIAAWPSDPTTSTAYPYFAGIQSRADDGTAGNNACSTSGATCLFYHSGATVEDAGITAMSSRAGGCPEATGSLLAGCRSSFDETTLHSATNVTCANAGATGQGCYDVTP